MPIHRDTSFKHYRADGRLRIAERNLAEVGAWLLLAEPHHVMTPDRQHVLGNLLLVATFYSPAPKHIIGQKAAEHSFTSALGPAVGDYRFAAQVARRLFAARSSRQIYQFDHIPADAPELRIHRGDISLDVRRFMEGALTLKPERLQGIPLHPPDPEPEPKPSIEPVIDSATAPPESPQFFENPTEYWEYYDLVPRLPRR